MIKRNCVFIDLSNAEQVRWWNNTAYGLVKVVDFDKVEDETTGKKGMMFYVEGLLANWVIENNNRKFLRDTTMVMV